MVVVILVEGFETEVGEFKEPVKLRLRGSWEDVAIVVVVDEVVVVAPARPEEEEDLEGAGVRLVS